ncbi:MAG: STAS domain-containing protein [Primorskyibacter sp.]
MSEHLHEYALPERRPRSRDDPLIGFLTSAQDAPVQICVAAVDMLDSLRLRTLLAAQTQWGMRGIPFSVVNLSDGFRDGLTRLGVAASQFDMKEN